MTTDKKEAKESAESYAPSSMKSKVPYINYIFGDSLKRDPVIYPIGLLVYNLLLFGSVYVLFWLTGPRISDLHLLIVLGGAIAMVMTWPALTNAYKNQRYTHFAYGVCGILGILTIDFYFMSLVIYDFPPLETFLTLAGFHCGVVLLYLFANYLYYLNDFLLLSPFMLTIAYLYLMYNLVENILAPNDQVLLMLCGLVLLQLISIRFTLSFRRWFVGHRHEADVRKVSPTYNTTSREWEEYEAEQERKKQEHEDELRLQRQRARDRSTALEPWKYEPANETMATADPK